MRKLISLFLALTLALSLGACSGGETPATSSTSLPAASQESSSPPVVTVPENTAEERMSETSRSPVEGSSKKASMVHSPGSSSPPGETASPFWLTVTARRTAGSK